MIKLISIFFLEFVEKKFCVITKEAPFLPQILCDPLGRTLRGLHCVIAKHWVALGHPFTSRLGHTTGHNALEKQKRGEYFLLFLDCLHQLCIQNPHMLEYTPGKKKQKKNLFSLPSHANIFIEMFLFLFNVIFYLQYTAYLASLWSTAHCPLFSTFLFDSTNARNSTLCVLEREKDPPVLWDAWHWWADCTPRHPSSSPSVAPSSHSNTSNGGSARFKKESRENSNGSLGKTGERRSSKSGNETSESSDNNSKTRETSDSGRLESSDSGKNTNDCSNSSRKTNNSSNSSRNTNDSSTSSIKTNDSSNSRRRTNESFYDNSDSDRQTKDSSDSGLGDGFSCTAECRHARRSFVSPLYVHQLLLSLVLPEALNRIQVSY